MTLYSHKGVTKRLDRHLGKRNLGHTQLNKLWNPAMRTIPHSLLRFFIESQFDPLSIKERYPCIT